MRELYPGTPRSGDFPAPPDARPWFALTVKPQHEARVQERLTAKGIRAYTPLYWTAKRWSDRVKRLQLPLFPGYVFCNFEPSGRADIIKTAGVHSLICFGGAPAPIPDQQIAGVQAMIASKYTVEPWPFMPAGQRVRIAEGSLAGLEGVLVRHLNSTRVIVSLDILQRSVSVEVRPTGLIPVGSL